MLFTQQWLQISQSFFNTFFFSFFSWGHAKTRLLTSALLIGLLISSLWCSLINMQKKRFLILLCIMLADYFIKTFIELDFARHQWQLQNILIMFVLLFSLQVQYLFICTFCSFLILGGRVMEQAITMSSLNKLFYAHWIDKLTVFRYVWSTYKTKHTSLI